MSDLIEKAINTRLNQSQNTDKPINAIVPQKETQPKPFLQPFTALIKDYQPPKWLVKGIIPNQGLIEFFGASGSFKSFIVLDIGYCISTGISWHGHEVKQGNVVYFAGEGHHGLISRVNALQRHYGKPPDGFYRSEKPINLSDEKELQEISEYLKQIGNIQLVIIDTLHRNSGESDEDSAKDFAKVLKNIDKYLAPYAKVIMWVHHTGHGTKERSRGTSARYASLDACYLIKRDDDSNIIEMKCTKMKDAEEPKPMMFEMESIETELINPDTNEQIRSLVPVKTDKTGSTTKDKPLTKRQKDVLSALRLAIKNDGRELPAEIKEREGFIEGRGVKLEQWRDEAYKVIDVDSDDEKSKMEAKKKAFQRVRKELKERDKVVIYDEWCYVPSDCKRKYQRDKQGQKPIKGE
ncbi:AAA family ATPase [Hydrogenimonas thermophila]|uniref:AAA domain-containing protein n=1 Tax=Hydrogenimonas thermophila TaxID=223786 RepID=A0A1I5LHN9_9BACT|nr:AAA family ATPase [Hydrogenimonas thermophila]SFO96889.1 AAA domain-containing protein [Hydrogenimonas thermophila]